MANHLTPAELAEQLKMERQEVIGRCVQMGVPIFHGRIDRSLFETAVRSMNQAQSPQATAQMRH
jgi:uncharacterized protein (DUF58 family)